jgi:hypothetical protein
VSLALVSTLVPVADFRMEVRTDHRGSWSVKPNAPNGVIMVGMKKDTSEKKAHAERA